MKINTIEFITSYASSDAYGAAEHTLPEICVVGRSNVGKSTFINMLSGRKIAKTSSQPGRTRLINLFDINSGEFVLVDLPGYGYAKASKSEKYQWQSLAGGYFEASKSLKRVFLLVDCRVESPLDKQMIDFLYYYQIPFTILASKCDKVNKSQLASRVMNISSFFKIGKDDVIAVSNKGLGKDKVLTKMKNILYPDDIFYEVEVIK